MASNSFSVVTGAFSYTGKYITERLLASGKQVKTLTGHPDRPDPFEGRVSAMPYNFENPTDLTRSLEGADVLYNTYWVRFPRDDLTHARATEQSKTLFMAAKEAGVQRIVHVSITSASSDFPLPYFRGKGLLEEALRESGMSHAIVRPTVIYGKEDILVNNIAWAIRKFPIFTIPGSGNYRVQPIFVEDMAQIVVDAGQRQDNQEIDAVGPDIFTFNEMVLLIGEKIGKRPRLVHVHPRLAFFLTSLVGYAVKDVTLTRDEISGLMENLLVSDQPPPGRTRLGDWVQQNASWLGTRYASEVQRHY